MFSIIIITIRIYSDFEYTHDFQFRFIILRSDAIENNRSATSEMQGNNQHNADIKSKQLLTPLLNFNNMNSSAKTPSPSEFDPDQIIIRFFGNKLHLYACPFKSKAELHIE